MCTYRVWSCHFASHLLTEKGHPPSSFERMGSHEKNAWQGRTMGRRHGKVDCRETALRMGGKTTRIGDDDGYDKMALDDENW